MRRVTDPPDLAHAVREASSEAASAFGDGAVYLEKLVDRPRHVEVQILRSRGGETVALGERECSVQRRHQKLIEESPSPAVTPALRKRLEAAAVAVAEAAGYENAGTVEFLIPRDGPAGSFYFIEVNARLQVEHPVTEMVTGVDIVAEQFRIAAGEKLSPAARKPARRGHAIEARITSEDAGAGFLPSTGRIEALRVPGGPFLRWDSGVEVGSDVTYDYDPMLAKLIAWGETREEARLRLLSGLRELTIVGVTTCVPFHLAVLASEEFARGDLDIGFVARPWVAAALRPTRSPEAEAVVTALAHARRSAPNGAAAPSADGRSLWGREALREGLRTP